MTEDKIQEMMNVLICGDLHINTHGANGGPRTFEW
jgi:homoaconitase/3-isopropylmalate dehydratase large subunit